MRIRNRNRKAWTSLSCLLISATLLLVTEANLMAAGSVTLDGTLGPSATLAGPNYSIPDTVGSRAGNNLFHSFGTFSIGTGESATFSGAAGISNIIGRVTGGTPSSIDGIIRSTIDGANLFLLNPSGILFGPNARLDVMGSFHASTADYLKFDNGEMFSASTATSPVLSVAQPSAFGFLGAVPAPISIDRSVLEVPVGQTISIVGGDLSIRNDPLAETYFDYVNSLPGTTYYTLSAPSGRINLASVASQGEVIFSGQSVDATSFSRLGRIELLDSANLNVSSDFYGSGPAGSVVIRGGEMLFLGTSIDASGSPPGSINIAGDSLTMDASPFSILNYGDVNHLGTAAEISLTNAFSMMNTSTIDSSAVAGGKSGDILLTAGTIEMSGESYLSSQTFGTAPSGNITLTASSIRMFDAPYIDTSTSGPARGGNIILNAPTITLGNSTPGAGFGSIFGTYGYIGSRSNPGASGRGGDISLTGRDITVQNGFFIATAALDAGDAGNITVRADTLNCLNQGNVSSNAYAVGTGGTVDISARNILLSAKDKTLVENLDSISGFGAQVRNNSNGGKIRVTAENLQIHDGGKISSVLYGTGRGSDIEIAAHNITIDGYNLESQQVYALSAIDARLFGTASTGIGGNISLSTDSLNISNGGAIRSALQLGSTGGAGDIAITAKTIDISSRGQIYADSFRGSGSSTTDPSTGNSGDITVNADRMTVTGAKYIPRLEPLDFDFTGLSTSTNAGTGGAINVALTGDLTLTAAGGIKADTQGTGLGGTITIAAKNILMNDNGNINASSTGTGLAGNINLIAGDTLQLRNASITTEASVEADGGNITIMAPNKITLYNSRITSSVGGGPATRGGNISIDPQFLILKNSQIVANAYAGTGGNITIIANNMLADPSSVVDASSQLGISGNVDIQAPVNNISGLLNPLSSDYVSASALLRERCIARIREGKYSSFVIGGRDGLPVEPGNMMPGLSY